MRPVDRANLCLRTLLTHSALCVSRTGCFSTRIINFLQLFFWWPHHKVSADQCNSSSSSWRLSSSGIWRRVVRWVAPDVSEERIASIFRVEELVRQTSEQAEDGGDTFLLNVGCNSTDYMALFITTAVKTSNPTYSSSSFSTFCIRPSVLFPSELIRNYESYRQSAGLLWWVIRPVPRPLPTQNTNIFVEGTRTDIYACSGIRTHDPSVWAGEDISCLRPRGHCDRLAMKLRKQKNLFQIPLYLHNILLNCHLT
jgi:hypothetical protein